MKQKFKSWLRSEYVDFEFAECKVETAMMHDVYEFEIREAIFQHLASMAHSLEACIESGLEEPDGLCRMCHSDYRTTHATILGVSFIVETIHGSRLTRVYRPKDQD